MWISREELTESKVTLEVRFALGESLTGCLYSNTSELESAISFVLFSFTTVSSHHIDLKIPTRMEINIYIHSFS